MRHQPLARVVRSGLVEGVHHGTAIAMAADGAIVRAAGDVAAPLFPRSAVKPLQLVGMLRHGLHLTGPHLALAAASHSGEDFHLEGVRAMLQAHGIDETALDNTRDLPLDEARAREWLWTGKAPSRLAQNCSGKHAAMLATCAVNGWPATGYLRPDHPVQLAIRHGVEQLAGEVVSAVGVDGCGAPVLALTLTGLARAFAQLATAADGTTEAFAAQAIREYPQWLGGTRREVTELIRGVPGLIAKDGAESVWAAALPDGRAVAVKIADGGARAVPPVLAALLRAVGEDAPFLADFGYRPVLGHGEPVGAVEALI